MSMIVTGDKQIDRILRGLDTRVQRRIARRSTRRGAAKLRDAARAIVPKRTGTLRKSINVASSRSQSSRSEFVYKVGPNVGKKKAPHAHLVEFGTAPRVVRLAKLRDRRTGEIRIIPNLHVGRMRPQPYLRPAFDRNRVAIASFIERDMRVEIVKEAKKQRAN